MTIYKNLRVFTMNEEGNVFLDGYIKENKGMIEGIGDQYELTPQDLSGATIVDCKGKIAIPGMITTHAHFYGMFARGMSVTGSIRNWQQVLSNMWWKMDKALTTEQSYYSAMLGLMDGLKAGTTTYFDHQASPNATDGILDVLEGAVRQAGARACLSYEVSDRDGEEHAKSGIEENVRFIKKAQAMEDKQIKALFGLHAGYSLSPQTLECCSAYGKELHTGFHIHIAEAMADVSESYRLYDKHVVNRLYDAGILTGTSIAAHSVHVTKEEWDLYKETGTTVAHNVQSNTNNAVGICPVTDMMADGVAVAIGGDGFTYDLYRELNFAIMMQKLRTGDTRTFSGEQIRRFAFANPGELASRVFGMPMGVLAKGAPADFVLIDYDEPTRMDSDNIFSHLTGNFSGNVKNVFIGGNEVVRDGKCTQIDEERVLAQCREKSLQLWKSLG